MTRPYPANRRTPKDNRFEVVAGARRFRAGQIAEIFSLPARIVELDDA